MVNKEVLRKRFEHRHHERKEREVKQSSAEFMRTWEMDPEEKNMVFL